MKQLRSPVMQIAAVLLLAAAWKMVFFFWDVVPFNSDEAIVALMARHILAGERPVFFYGQAYMGSLDAFLAAGGFALFGQQVWVIRLVQALLYLSTVFTTILIGKNAFNDLKAGLLAGLLLAVPTVNLNLYTTASLGGYGEALLLGSLVLLLSLKLGQWITGDETRLPRAGFGAWGLLAGCGLWANGLTLVFSFPSGLYLLWAIWKCRRGSRGRWLGSLALAGGVGLALGALPWWIYAAVHGPNQLVLELFGSAVAVERASWLARTGLHLINFLLLGASVIFGFRPPWNVTWLGLPLLPLTLAAWIGILWFFARQLRKKSSFRSIYSLFGGIFASLLAGFLFTAFGVDPSGRYFLPLSIPLALIAGQAVNHLGERSKGLAAAVTVLLVGYQLWGTVQCALAYPPGLTTQIDATTIVDHRADQDLIRFLRQEGETRGYTSYWVAYPLAFQSAEEIIFIPRLPYHADLRYTPRDDRYPAYTQMVARSKQAAYITARNPALDDYLRAHFRQLGVTWSERKIGDYLVYFHLSRAVTPQEIGLGESRE